MSRKTTTDIDKLFCSVEGCENIAKARGLCSKHHQQWYRSGKTKEYKFKSVIPRCKTPGCENSGHKELEYCPDCYEKIQAEVKETFKQWQ